MLSEFLTELTKGLPGRWLERMSGPAFLFWVGGLLIVFGPAELAARWPEWLALPAPVQVGALVAALLVLNASAVVMERLRLPLLYLLEGYWPPPLHYLAAWLVAWNQRRAQRQRRRWSDLMQKRDVHQQPLTRRERDELACLEQALHDIPRDLPDLMPTALGNILRAAETRIWQRYGLDAVLLWPRLWLLLPDEVRQQIATARAALDRLVEAWGWGLLFFIWTYWWPGAALIAIAWMFLAARLARQPARTFAILVQSAFDLYRWRLYEALHWPLPTAMGETEIVAGQALTRYIQRGMLDHPLGKPTG